MGRDKALIELGGRTLLERVADASVAAGARAIVVGRPRPEAWRGPELEFVADDRPGEGPLRALATALRYADSPVALIPCDLPRVDAAAVAWLLCQVPPPDGAVVVRAEGRVQPLFAVYDAGVFDVAQSLLQDGTRSLMRLLTAIDVWFVDVPAAFEAAIRDADVPADLQD